MSQPVPPGGPFLPPPPRRAPLLAALGVLFVLAGLALSGWGAQTAYDAHRLRGDSATVTATVTGAQEHDTRAGTHAGPRVHQVRYSFHVPGDDATYHAEDDVLFLDQDDVWVELSEDHFRRARDTGHIKVEYLRSDPSINQPRDARRSSWSAALFFLLGLVPLALGTALVIGGLRRVAPLPPTPTD